MRVRTNDDPVDQLCLLWDAIAEHNPDDPNFGPPDEWPWWTDATHYGLGPPSLGFDVDGEKINPCARQRVLRNRLLRRQHATFGGH